MASLGWAARARAGLLHPELAARPQITVTELEARLWPVRAGLGLAVVLLAISLAPRASPVALVSLTAAYAVAYLGLTGAAWGPRSGRLASGLIALDLLAAFGLVLATGGSQRPALLLDLLPVGFAGAVWGLGPALGVATVAGAGLALTVPVTGSTLPPLRDAVTGLILLYAVGALSALVRQARAAGRTHATWLAEEIGATAVVVDGAPTLATSLACIGSKIHQLTGATMTVLWTVHEREEGLAVGWSAGMPPAYPVAARDRVPDPPADGRADPGGGAAPPGPAAPLPLRAVLDANGWAELRSLPITLGERPVGRVDLAFARPRRADGNALRLTDPLRHQAGVAIDRELRIAALSRRATDLVRLQEGLLGLTTESGTPRVLRTAIGLSRELTRAAYAAIAIWDADGELVQFETSGVPEAVRDRLGHGPSGIGLLGTVASGHAPVRLADASRHPSVGTLPPGHPPLTSFLGVPVPHLGSWRGAFYLAGKQDEPEFTLEDEQMGRMIAAHVSAILQLQRLVSSERDTHEGLLRTLVALSDAREHAVDEHSHRVSAYAQRLAAALGVGLDEGGTVGHGALLHDIGKMGVPDHILQKRGPLTDQEREVMMAHAPLGAEIVGGVRSLAGLRPAIRHHHERWDGRGYPDALAGEAIPLAARIVAVADALDSMTTDRPYRAARSMRAALTELERGAGSQFDPRIARAAVTLFGPDASDEVVAPEPSGPALTLAERHATVQTAAWRLYGRLGQELRSVLDLPTLARRILELLDEELRLAGGELSTLSRGRATLVVVGAHGVPQVMEIGTRRARGHGLMWAALDAGRPLVLTDAESDPRYSGLPGAGHRAMAFVPLVSSEGPEGVLVGHRPDAEPFDDLQIRQLEAVAVPLAEALTVARLHRARRPVPR